MTTENLKQLAESAAEFLSDNLIRIDIHGVVSYSTIDEDALFFHPQLAPVLMHLAEQEMVSIKYKKSKDIHTYVIQHKEFKINHGSTGVDKNKFIAFWTALLEAVKK